MCAVRGCPGSKCCLHLHQLQRMGLTAVITYLNTDYVRSVMETSKAPIFMHSFKQSVVRAKWQSRNGPLREGGREGKWREACVESSKPPPHALIPAASVLARSPAAQGSNSYCIKSPCYYCHNSEGLIGNWGRPAHWCSCLLFGTKQRPVHNQFNRKLSIGLNLVF